MRRNNNIKYILKQGIQIKKSVIQDNPRKYGLVTDPVYFVENVAKEFASRFVKSAKTKVDIKLIKARDIMTPGWDGGAYMLFAVSSPSASFNMAVTVNWEGMEALGGPGFSGTVTADERGTLPVPRTGSLWKLLTYLASSAAGSWL